MYRMFGVIEKSVKGLPAGNLTPIQYHDFEDALGAARNLNARGGIAVLIEGDDGSRLEKLEIVEAISKRGPLLDGRPKVY